jgi:hypothetical protein
MIITPTDSFTRPGDTTSYTAADLVANDVDAGDVVPLTFGSNSIGTHGIIRRVRLYKSSTTATAATFVVHLFSVAPVVTNGDNGAFAVSTAANYLDEVAVDMSSGASVGTAYLYKPSAAVAIGFNFAHSGSLIYGLIEASGAYAPASAEVFQVTLEIESNGP